MSHEIERKFLVKGDFRPGVVSSSRIVQGYLSSVPERSVRIRVMDHKGFITVKGIGDESGMRRFEWEKEIPEDDALALLSICEPGVIDKIRHIVPEKSGLSFEVDEFFGDNSGLLIAEIELPESDHPFEKPGWLGEEVTGQPAYYNASLMKKPYKDW